MAGGRSQAMKAVHYRTDSSGRTRPYPNAVPTVTGTNTVGQTLTGVNGTFFGNTTVTITRQWMRGGVDIPGATGATYVLQAADSGKTVYFKNIGTNNYGVSRMVSLGRSIA